MSSLDMRHPENDLLLQFLDGELSRSRARHVRRHVEACWQCRAELDELQKLVKECVRYRETLAESVPPPPQAWTELSRELSRLDDVAPRTPFFRRTPLRWVLLGAGAASLVAATLALHIVESPFRAARPIPQQTRPGPQPVLPRQQDSPASTIPRADGVMPSVRGRAPLSRKVEEPAGVADELRAVAVLHRLGADLGEPVEVELNGAHVVVGGTGVAPGMERQIRDALASEPKVVLQFSEPAAAPPVAPPATAAQDDAPPKPVAPSAPSPLEAQIGGRAQLERLSSQLLNHDEAAMTRVYALRRLAEQFPPEAERQLSSGDRRLLKDLGWQHVDAMAQELAAMDSMALPLLGSPGAATEPINPATTWEAAAQNLFVSARKVETLLPVWLGATAPGSARPVNLPQQLSSALAQFRSDVQQCERLLKP